MGTPPGYPPGYQPPAGYPPPPGGYGPQGYGPPAYAGPPGYGPSSEAGVEPAGFGIRFAARALDIGAVMILGAVGGAFAGIVLGVLTVMHIDSAKGVMGGVNFTAIGFGLLSSLAYHSLSEGLAGASFGKLILGLRVKREETFEPCGIGRAIVRNLGYYIDAFFFGLVAYSVMSGSLMKQRLGDKWGGTVVVKAAGLPANQRAGLALGLVLASFVYIILSIAGTLIGRLL